MKGLLRVEGLEKSFTLHLQGGTRIPVFENAWLALEAGECAVLAGASGTGKSTLLRLIYGNYRALGGSIALVHDGAWVELVGAEARVVLEIRRRTLGYVSQFLRCVPRKPASEIVAEPLLALGCDEARALDAARALLARLNIPERLWALPPATFSGGEQQRVNIARGFIHPYPILLLDEPTASLDPRNRAVVVELIDEARQRGAAMLGIFHDRDVRDRIADRMIDVEAMRAVA